MTDYPKIMDAAFPPQALPPGVEGVLGYVGGRALHTWTPEEWRRFQHVPQFPAYVAAVGGVIAEPDARQAGMEAVRAVRALGWAPDMPAASNRVIVVDLETAVNAAWYAEIADVIAAGGFTAVAYGSAGSVFANAADDVILAEWIDSTVAPAVPKGQTLRGLQYDGNVSFGGTQIDLSVFGPWLMARGGVGPRHG